MDNIWKNTTKKQCARDLRNTTVKLTITAPVQTANTLPVTATTTPKWCDPETVTLKQIVENTQQLLREWPKDNGTLFLMEVLEVLMDLKLRVRARDTVNNCSTMVSEATNTDTADVICTPALAYLIVIDTIEPNTPVPNLWDLISATMDDTVQPTMATVYLWRKLARKAAKIAYQRNYYKEPVSAPLTTTTTIPTHNNTSTPAISETATMPERLDWALDIQHVTPVPARSEVKLTSTATTAVDLNTTTMTIEQPDNRVLAAKREKEQERRVEKQNRVGEQEAEQQEESDTGGQEGIKESQSEVQDNPPPPTAHTMFDMTTHEPQQFNWVMDIDQSISPVPSASNFRPTMPLQHIRTRTPAAGAPSDHVPAASTLTNGTPAAYTPTASAFDKPGDVAIEPAPVHSMHVSTIPADFTPVAPKPEPVSGALTNTSPTVPIGLPATSASSSITPIENAAAVPSIPVMHGPQDFSAL